MILKFLIIGVAEIFLFTSLSFAATAPAAQNNEMVNLRLNHIAAAMEIAHNGSELASLLEIKLSKEDSAYLADHYVKFDSKKGEVIRVTESKMVFSNGSEITNTMEILDAKAGEFLLNGKKYSYDKKSSLEKNTNELLKSLKVGGQGGFWRLPEAQAFVGPILAGLAVAYVGVDLMLAPLCSIMTHPGRKYSFTDMYWSCLAHDLGLKLDRDELNVYDIECPQENPAKSLNVKLKSGSEDRENRSFILKDGELVGVEAKVDNASKNFYSVEYNASLGIKQITDRRGSRDIVMKDKDIDPAQKKIATALLGDYKYYAEICKDPKRLATFRLGLIQERDKKKAVDIVPDNQRGTR